MAVYDDWPGIWASIQAFRTYFPHLLPEVELIVVDNAPARGGQHVQNLIEGFCRQPGTPFRFGGGARYIPMPEPVGTTAPRQRVFDEATGDYVVCTDSHIFFWPGAPEALLGYYAANPDSSDLISGPIVWDCLCCCATHMEDVWRGGMWGVWANDPRGDIGRPEGQKGWAFPIPAMGLGLFSCRRAAWPGFNSKFREFGGEEFYIHTKFRQRGNLCLCLPKLRWDHRFRAGGVMQTSNSYPARVWHKVRNYVIGHAELGLPLERLRRHFVDGVNEDGTPWAPGEREVNSVSASQWVALTKDPHNPPEQDPGVPGKDPGCGTCGQQAGAVTIKTIDEWYERARSIGSDINEHCPTLREYAARCKHVTEFGMRYGVSTVALLAAQPDKFTTYDLNRPNEVEVLDKMKGRTDFRFHLGSSLTVDIEETDMLFIDTRHTYEHCYAELARHAGKVRKYIAFHDTEIYGERGEDGSPGIRVAIRRFILEHPEWHTIKHWTNNYGFTIISRLEEDKPPALPSIWKMGVNYARSEMKDLANGRARVPLEVKEARHAICTSNGGVCPLAQRRIDDDRCAGCGCYLTDQPGSRPEEKTGKTWRPLDSCPFQLWGNWDGPVDLLPEVANAPG
jgi:hypothetical protein